MASNDTEWHRIVICIPWENGRNWAVNRREFLSGATLAATFAVGPSLRSARAAELGPGPTESGGTPPVVGRSTRILPWNEIPVRRLTTSSQRQFRCLQVTDLHQFHTTAADDDQTFADIARYVRDWHPDLIFATGDLWHDNDHGEGPRGVDRLVRDLGTLGVPWTTIWGNHDRLDDYQAGHDALAGAPHSVYGGAHSHGDYRLEVLAFGSDKPALDLLCLNSNHEGLGPWQVNALRQLIDQVRSRSPGPGQALLFHHIPMQELKTRFSVEAFRGLKMEDVASLQDQGRTFPVVRDAGFIRACFCGHNHVNDYTLQLDRVSLSYGRSTGHAGYGGERLRKGAKLIEVDLSNGEVQTSSVFPDGTRLA